MPAGILTKVLSRANAVAGSKTYRSNSIWLLRSCKFATHQDVVMALWFAMGPWPDPQGQALFMVQTETRDDRGPEGEESRRNVMILRSRILVEGHSCPKSPGYSTDPPSRCSAC